MKNSTVRADVSTPTESPLDKILAEGGASIAAPARKRKSTRGLHKVEAEHENTAVPSYDLAGFLSKTGVGLDGPAAPDVATRADVLAWRKPGSLVNVPILELRTASTGTVHGKTVPQWQYNRLEEYFAYTDSNSRMLREYRTLRWHSDLRMQADTMGPTVWTNSLHAFGQLNDGMWVMESPLDPPDDDDTGKKGKGGGGGGKPPTWQQITTTPMFISGLVVDDKKRSDGTNGDNYVEISFLKVDGLAATWHKVLIGFEQLQDERGAVFKTLARSGLLLGPNERKCMQQLRTMVKDYQAMAAGNPSRYYETGRSKAGWFNVDVEGGTALAYITAGFNTCPQVRYTGPMGNRWETKGDQGLYLRRMADTLRANPVVGLLCGFNAAGLMLSFFPAVDHNPLWSILGDSSIGKSLAAQTTMSMRGNALTLTRNMDATDGALKERMRTFNHTGGVVDEIGSGERKDVREKLATIYQWASGNPRERTKRDALTGNYVGADDNERLYYTLLLTGEEAFVDMNVANVGNKVRLTQLTFSKENPIWHGITDKNEAEEWRTFFSKNYGWLYPRMVALIAEDFVKEEPRYQATYEYYSALLSAQVQTQQQARKTNSWALAMTGVQLVADALSTVPGDEEEEVFQGLTDADVDVVYQHAVRLMKGEMDAMPIETETEKFMDFLESLSTVYKPYMYIEVDGITEEPRDDVKGKYTMYKDKSHGLVRVHELLIVKKHFPIMCGANTISEKLLVEWAKTKGILVTSTEKKADSSTTTRTTVKQTVAPRTPATHCYKFVWRVADKDIVHDIDFGESTTKK